jgi:threonine dehydrogenase-like Zn-dependent dehydrogenase
MLALQKRYADSEGLELAASGRVALAPLVGQCFPLAEWRRAFEAITSRTPGKVLLIP